MHETTSRLSAAIFDRASASEGSSSLYILWGFFAVAAVAAAVATCFTPGADRRFTAAISTPPGMVVIASPAVSPAAAPVTQPPTPVIALTAPAAETPDDKLIARLRALEDQIGTMTGSITTSSPAPSEPAAAVTPVAESPKQVRTTSINPEAETEAPVTRTTFGVDLGSEASFGALRMRWDSLRRKYPELARLSPRISVRDNKGKVEIRLIAGPFENAADAAKACAGLLAKGAVCDGGLFDGQRLPAS